jgi:C4-dicarboxylate-specific signal transduction histidine kinase
MLVGVVVFLAALLQYVAAALSLRLWRVAGRSPVWLIITAVTLLTAVRRTISLYQLGMGARPQRVDLVDEYVGLAISILMVVAVAALAPFFSSILKSREELQVRTRQLDDRIRELNCLFAMADLVNQPGISIDEIIQGTVDLIPGALRFPIVACARVSLDGREYKTSNFHEPSWRQVEPILVYRKPRGEMEVGYLSRQWPAGQGPFLEEEARLLSAIAERMGRIIERHEAQEELRRHREELAHVSRLSTMGEMASSLAHELNQPLSAIANYVRGCQRRMRGETWDRDELLEAMEAAASQAERAGRIVGSLRDFVAKREPRRLPVEINRVVAVAVDLVIAEAKVRGGGIRFEPAAGLRLVLADAIQIEQVILNVVRNALEAMGETGTGHRDVVIRTVAGAPGTVEVAISDSGPGLPEGAVDKVFDAFYTTKSEGMGIGLSISRTIIEAHRGRLWATVNEDCGMTFHFTLPVDEGGERHDV